MFAEQNIPYEVSVKKSLERYSCIELAYVCLKICDASGRYIQAGMQVLMDKRFGDKCTKRKQKTL